MTTMKEVGRRILAEQEANKTTRADAVIDGVKPKRGMWLVNHERRRIYGIVKTVHGNGDVTWLPVIGVISPNRTEPETLHHGGASYEIEMPSSYEYMVGGVAQFRPLQPNEEIEMPQTSPTPVQATVEAAKKAPAKKKAAKKAPAKKAPAKKVSAKVNGKLDELAGKLTKSIVAHVRKNPGVTCPAVATAMEELLGGDRRQRFQVVRKYMRALAREGVLQRVEGKSPTGRKAFLFSVT